MTDKQERLFEVMMRSVLNLRVNKEGITYKKFCGLYFSQWYSNFEDDARKEGFINGFNAIRSVEGVSLNGSIITVTSTNKIVQEIADVMAASVSKPKSNKSKKRTKSPMPVFERTANIPADNNAQRPPSRFHGGFQSTRTADPYESNEEDDFIRQPANKNTQQKNSFHPSPFESGSFRSASNFTNGRASAPPRNQFQPAPPARDMSTSSPGFRSFSSTHNEPPSHPAPAPSPPPMTPPVRQRSPIRVSACASPPIKKDGCLIFKDNMEERIAAISKEIDHLVNGILNYGNTDTLSIDEIKSFINSSELAGQITIKQLSALVTLFTPWKAVSKGFCVDFTLAGKKNIVPFSEFYNDYISVPQNKIEIGGQPKDGRIINVYGEVLVIRLCEQNGAYEKFKREMKLYYQAFLAQKDSPISDLATPVKHLFVGEYVLYHDEDNSRFLRCSIYYVADTGDLTIYCIDEGIYLRTSPSKIFRMPWRLRKYEPFSISFETRTEKLEKLSGDNKEGVIAYAEKAKKTGEELRFKFMGYDKRPYMPDLFVGPWIPGNRPT